LHAQRTARHAQRIVRCCQRMILHAQRIARHAQRIVRWALIGAFVRFSAQTNQCFSSYEHYMVVGLKSLQLYPKLQTSPSSWQ
jgi:hypothetical protein